MRKAITVLENTVFILYIWCNSQFQRLHIQDNDVVIFSGHGDMLYGIPRLVLAKVGSS